MASDDVQDLLTALSAAGVRYIVVGAYALAHHGLVRATGDIDLLVEPPDRIDIHSKIAGLRFERAWKGRVKGEFEGVPTPVLGIAELIAAKRASARKRDPGSSKALQDAADLAWLLERHTARYGSMQLRPSGFGVGIRIEGPRVCQRCGAAGFSS